MTVTDVLQGLAYIKSSADITVVIVEFPSELDNIKDLTEYIENHNNDIVSVSILILTDELHESKDSAYLGGAVVDCIRLPFTPPVVKKRIQNAEKLVGRLSFTEFAKMLKVLPANIYLKDANGRYVFSTQTWHHLDTGGDPDWTIRGKTDLDIRKDKENALIAMESDKRLLETGVGTSYVIEENEDGIHEYLQLIKEPLFYENGKIRGIIALINNVTEAEQMRQKLKEQSIRDTLTGLYNRTYLDEYISILRDKNVYPICVFSMDCDNLKLINDTYGHIAGDKYIVLCVKTMKSLFPMNTCLFRTGGDEFLSFVPNMSEMESGLILKALNTEHFEESGFPINISAGCAEVRNSEESILETIKLSDKAMYTVKQNKKRHS